MPLVAPIKRKDGLKIQWPRKACKANDSLSIQTLSGEPFSPLEKETFIVLPISAGSKNSDPVFFRKAVDALERLSKTTDLHVLVLVADDLQSYTYLMDGKTTEEEAKHLAAERGETFLKLSQAERMRLASFSKTCSTSRWKELFDEKNESSSKIKMNRKILDSLLKEGDLFYKKVEKAKRIFLDNYIETRKNKLSEETFREKGALVLIEKYLLEELSVDLFLKENWGYISYPFTGDTCNALRKCMEFVLGKEKILNLKIVTKQELETKKTISEEVFLGHFERAGFKAIWSLPSLSTSCSFKGGFDEGFEVFISCEPQNDQRKQRKSYR